MEIVTSKFTLRSPFRLIVPASILFLLGGGSGLWARDSRSTEREPAAQAGRTETDTVHTPAHDSQEENEIVKGVLVKKAATSDFYHIYYTFRHEVLYLKVHNGWAWTRVRLYGKSNVGTTRNEIWEGLLHKDKGEWTIMDLPEGLLFDRRQTKSSIKKIKTKYPSVSTDIFPTK